MDDSRNGLTNVYKVDDVLLVQWATYATAEDNDGDPLAEESDREKEHDTLQAAEHGLRKLGHHVLYDVDARWLWVFQLSGPSVLKNADVESKAASRDDDMSAYDLKHVASGTLRALDIPQGSLDNHTSERSFGAERSLRLRRPSNHQRFNRNRFTAVDPVSHATGLPMATAFNTIDSVVIFQFVLSAISKTLSYFLVFEKHYTPVAPGVFAICEENDFLPNLDYTLGEHYMIPTRNRFFCVSIRWLSCGTLVIVARALCNVLWQSVANTVELHIPYGKQQRILLAPLGRKLVATIHAVPESGLVEAVMADTASSTTDKGTEMMKSWKHQATVFLKRCGMVNIDEACWILIELTTDTLTATGIDMPPGEHRALLWPAHLCFYENDIQSGAANTESEDWDSILQMEDPLTAAKSWFMGQGERDRRVEASRREMQEARANSSSGSISSGGRDFYEARDQALDPQAINGIYPTPSDGPGTQERSVYIDGMELSTTTPGTIASMNMRGDRLPNTTVVTEVSQNPGTNLGDYDHLEHDDLFRDMDASFAANGLTEDDFNFFDTPDHPHQDFSHLEQASKVEGDSLTDALPSSPQNTFLYIQNDDLEMRSGSLTSSSVQGSPYHSDMDPQDDTEANGAMNGRPSPKCADERYESEARHVQGDGTTGSMYAADSQGVYQTFDTKYEHKGKFAVNTVVQPGTSNPNLSATLQNTVPTLGILRTSNQDLDSDVESVSTSSENLSGDDQAFVPLQNGAVMTGSEHPISQDGAHQAAGDVGPGLRTKKAPHFHCSFKKFMTYRTEPLIVNAPYMQSASKFQTRELVDKELVDLAQIVADQLLFSTSMDNHCPLNASRPLSFDLCNEVVSSLFTRSRRCTMVECASLCEELRDPSDETRKQPRQIPKRQDLTKNEGTTVTPRAFFLPSPDLRIRRGEVDMDISSHAVEFWKELGLGPSSGTKDIYAFYLYPDIEVFRNGVRYFADSLANAYSTLKLGTHTSGHVSVGGFSAGFVPVTTGDGGHNGYLTTLSVACGELGKALSTVVETRRRTIAIYIVNPLPSLAYIPHVSLCFMKTLRNYSTGPTSRLAKSMVLKVIPQSWIASSVTLALPPSLVLTRLAKEMYDRCPRRNAPSPYASSSLIQIAQPLPQTIHFQLLADPLVNLFGRNTVTHVAYSWDIGLPWLSFSLCDNLGSRQWTASYNICNNDDPWSGFREVAQEVWTIVMDSIEKIHGHRVFLAKDQEFWPGEITGWLSIAAERAPGLTVTLVVIDEDCPINIVNLPPAPYDDSPQTRPSISHTLPEPISTLPLTFDSPAARLIDMRTSTWGLISQRAMVNAGDGFDLLPAIACGYLVRRHRTDGYVVGVRVVSSNRQKECDMKELLGMYRDLLALRELRGIWGHGPWHLAVARRAAWALNRYL